MNRDSSNGVALSVIAVIFVLSLMFSLNNPADSSTSGLVAILALGVSALIYFVLRLILKIYGKKSKLGPSPDTDESDAWAGFFTRKSTLLLVAFLAGKFILNTLARTAQPKDISGISIIFFHVLLLVILGILYARWAGTKGYVPIAATVVVVLADSAYYFVRYTSTSSYQFRFGPEIVWFAAAGSAGRLFLLPIFAVIIWGSWALSAVNRKRSKAPCESVLTTLDG